VFFKTAPTVNRRNTKCKRRAHSPENFGECKLLRTLERGLGTTFAGETDKKRNWGQDTQGKKLAGTNEDLHALREQKKKSCCHSQRGTLTQAKVHGDKP